MRDDRLSFSPDGRVHRRFRFLDSACLSMISEPTLYRETDTGIAMSYSRNPAKEGFIDRHQLWPFYRRRRYCDEVEDRKRTYASIARQFIGCKLPFDLFVLCRDEYIGQRTGGIHSCMRWRPQVWWSTRWDASLRCASCRISLIKIEVIYRPCPATWAGSIPSGSCPGSSDPWLGIITLSQCIFSDPVPEGITGRTATMI